MLHRAGCIQSISSNLEKLMFITDTFIDAVTTGNKQFINTVFANNTTIATALTGFADSQSAYTKQAVKEGTDSVTKLGSEFVKLTQEAAKFDYVKAAEKFSKSFTVAK